MRYWQRGIILAVAGFIVSSCASSDPVVQDELKLLNISPAQGLAGITVQLTGEGMAGVEQVCFASNCVAAVSATGTTLSVVVPKGKGVVDVKVVAGKSSSTLASAFTYTANEDPIDVPKLTGMAPTSGKLGTEITITGLKLDTSKEVCFGSVCQAPKSKSATEVKAIAPEGEGSVTVTLVVGESRLNAGQFSYIKVNPSTNAVDWCRLGHVPQSAAPGIGSDLIFAEVYEEGCTPNASKNCTNFVGQIGYVKEAAGVDLNDTTRYTWKNAERNSAFEGPSAAANDEYMASLSLEEGTYRIAYRFSTDSQNWLFCDYDDSNNGFNGEQTGRIVVAETPIIKPVIGWCRIVNGNTSIESKTGEKSEGIYAQAFVPNCTHYKTHCKDLKAEIGYGSPAMDKIENIAENFKWEPAKLNLAYDGSGGELHDEFQGEVSSSKAGNYSIVYRMTLDNGATYTYCDIADDGAFTPSNAIRWTVKDEGNIDPEVKVVGWCRLNEPTDLTVRSGMSTPALTASVWVDQCTGAAHDCPDLKGEFGYGKFSDTDFSSYKFTAASLDNSQSLGNNDVFKTVWNATATGEYGFAYRFSLNGKDWTYCDSLGVAAKPSENVGKISVVKDEDTVDFCRIQWPESSVITKGKASETYYGRVYVKGCTDADMHCKAVTAQVGYGSKTAKDATAFTYVDAAYNGAYTADNNDEYGAQLTINTTGDYAVVYRFSIDGRNTWTYCDYDNVPGFVLAKAASISVKDKSIEWCKLIGPSEVTVEKGADTVDIYGQALVTDCTGRDGVACTGLKAWVGYGPKDAKPSTYKYVEAAYAQNIGNNDEFVAKLNVETAGVYALNYAFSLDGGVTKTYCDKEASKPYNPDHAGSLTVTQQAITWCNLQHPQHVNVKLGETTETIYGQVYVPGCTGTDTACKSVKGYVAYGKDIDKTTPTFIEATYSQKIGNNDEYEANLKPTEVGNYMLAYAFSLDGGTTKTLCGFGGGSTFDPTKAGSLTVTKADVPTPKPGALFVRGTDYTCGIVAAPPTSKVGDITSYYAEIWIPGCTDQSDLSLWCNKVISSEILYTKEANATKPYTNAAWLRQTSAKNEGAFQHGGNNDNHIGIIKYTESGKYHLAYSFQVKHDPSDLMEAAQTVYCYVDWADSGQHVTDVAK